MPTDPTGSKIAQGYGAVTPKNRPEDFQKLREAFERGVADEQTIRSHEVITLSVQDSLLFVEALLNPPARNDALRGILDSAISRIRA